MKIRSGFVSNSSSSSFIISKENFSSVRELATYMINKQIEDRLDYTDDWKESALERYNQNIKRLQSVDENYPISFSSCNYDTYIKKIADCYLVSTCNNTDWELWDYTTRLTENARKALKEMRDNFLTISDEYQNIDYILHDETEFYEIGNDYYDLDHEIIGVTTYDQCTNKHIHGEGYHTNYLWNTPKWGKICLTCNPFYKRKDKLSTINEIAKENEL